MVEKMILNYLKKALTVPVLMEYPEKPCSAFVLVGKEGSGNRNHIYKATISVQSYDSTLAKTAALNESVKKAMQGLDELPDIVRVSLNSDYNFPDTTHKRHRYQAVYDVTHY